MVKSLQISRKLKKPDFHKLSSKHSVESCLIFRQNVAFVIELCFEILFSFKKNYIHQNNLKQTKDVKVKTHEYLKILTNNKVYKL